MNLLCPARFSRVKISWKVNFFDRIKIDDISGPSNQTYPQINSTNPFGPVSCAHPTRPTGLTPIQKDKERSGPIEKCINIFRG